MALAGVEVRRHVLGVLVRGWGCVVLFLAGCVSTVGVAGLLIVGGGVGVGVCIVASPSSSAGHCSSPVIKDVLLDSSVLRGASCIVLLWAAGGCARVCGMLCCARRWSLALLLVCVDVRGLPGCCVPSSGLVNDRTSYRCDLVAVLVGEAAAYCLHRVDVRRLFALLLYVALAWLMLLLLLLRLVMSN